MKGGEIYQDGSYLEHNPSWHREHSQWKASKVTRMLERNGLHPASVAEIGCGAGEVLANVAATLGAGVRCEGYDISPQAISLCREIERPGLTFHLADLLDAPVQFDVALSIDVFEHVDDYRGFLRRFREKATHKIFHIPLDLSVQLLLRGTPFAQMRESIGHIHFFTRDMALAVLAETGYEVRDWFYTHSSLELPMSLRSRLLKWPRAVMFRLCEDFAVRTIGGSSLMVLAR